MQCTFCHQDCEESMCLDCKRKALDYLKRITRARIKREAEMDQLHAKLEDMYKPEKESNGS